MLNLSLVNVPEYLDPTEAWNYQQFLLIQAVFDTLTRVNENGQIVASLAKKWSVDSTGRVYSMELRSDAHFHNGKVVESDDVAFSIGKHFWPSSKSVVKGYLNGILVGTDRVKNGEIPAGVKIIGKHSLSFNLVKPYSPFLSVLAMPGFSVFPKGFDIHKKANGSGPMKAEYLSDSKTWLLHRFDGYIGVPPKTAAFCIQRKAGIDEVLNAFTAGALDLAIGVPFGELDVSKVPSSVTVLRTNSLAFSHLYLNPRNQLLKDDDFRRDLASVIYSITEKAELISPFQKVSPYFMPKGILPSYYYERTLDKMPVEAFKRKWGARALNVHLKFVLPQTYFSGPLLKAFSGAFSLIGINADIEVKAGADLKASLDHFDFDLLSIPYMGNFPDPDGFLDLLHDGIGFKKGFEPSRKLFEKIEKARFISEAKIRLKAYADALLEFERLKYVIPLFQVNLPILFTNGIHVPDTSYRYEAELKNIFWQVEDRK